MRSEHFKHQPESYWKAWRRRNGTTRFEASFLKSDVSTGASIVYDSSDGVPFSIGFHKIHHGICSIDSPCHKNFMVSSYHEVCEIIRKYFYQPFAEELCSIIGELI